MCVHGALITTGLPHDLLLPIASQAKHLSVHSVLRHLKILLTCKSGQILKVVVLDHLYGAHVCNLHGSKSHT